MWKKTKEDLQDWYSFFHKDLRSRQTSVCDSGFVTAKYNNIFNVQPMINLTFASFKVNKESSTRLQVAKKPDQPITSFKALG